jgi:alpha-tubulin suppressor-like RCC1 family protein
MNFHKVVGVCLNIRIKYILPLMAIIILGIIITTPNVAYLLTDPINSSHRYIAVADGEDFIMALRSDGTVWTWGSMYCNDSVLSSTGVAAYYWVQPTPIQVPITDVIAIGAGDDFSIALKKDGTVWAWGSNFNGMLGDGTTTGTSRGHISIVQVEGLDNIIAISTGDYHTIALKKDGTVWAWGANTQGKLGDGTRENRHLPVQVKGLYNITSIWGGSFAIRGDGTVWTWGNTLLSSNSSDTNVTGNPVPFQIPGLKNIRAVDTDQTGGLSIYVENNGTVWCWGQDYMGQLGYGSNPYKSEVPYITTPVQAWGITNITAVSATTNGGMALKEDGTVWTWGLDGIGELDSGGGNIMPVPVKAPDLKDVIAISAKYYNSAFLKADGSVWVCGNGDYGQAGDGLNRPNKAIRVPVKVLAPDDTLTPTTVSTPTSTAPSNIDSFSYIWNYGIFGIILFVFFIVGYIVLLKYARKHR